MAVKITKYFGGLKATHPGENVLNLLSKLSSGLVLSPDSELDDTDRSYFDFHSNIFNFSNLQYSVSVYLSVRRQNLLSKIATIKQFVYFDLVSLQKSWNVNRVAGFQDF